MSFIEELKGEYSKEVTTNKIVYALIALFLGGIGAHHFYTGKTKVGIVYVVLFFVGGISGLLALFDVYLTFCKSKDNGDGTVTITPPTV